MANRRKVNWKAGNALQELSLNMGFKTNADLAKVLKLNKGTLSKIFSGETCNPSIQTTQKMVTAFASRSGQSPVEILEQIINIYNNSKYPYTPEDIEVLKQIITDSISKDSEEVIFSESNQVKTVDVSSNCCQSLAEDSHQKTEEDTVAKTSSVYQNLPTRDCSSFIGRDTEITRLLELLSPDCAASQISVQGMGGIGKTALVLEAAYRCLEASGGDRTSVEAPRFEAIIFTSAQQQHLTSMGIWQRRRAQQRTQRDIFRAIARTLNCPDITLASLDAQWEKIQEYLARQRTLLIVDNLETLDDREDVLPILSDLPPTVKVVVTTREHVPFIPICLECLPKEEALRLLVHQLQEKDVQLNNEQSQQLYQKTCGVPAAIVYTIGQLAAGYLLEDVLWKLTQSTSDISHYCFSNSIEPLLGQPPHQLLMALAMFPQPVKRDAIAYVADVEGHCAIVEGFARLIQLSLVNKQLEKYTMLPLTRSYVEAQLKTDSHFQQSAQARFVKWYLEFIRIHGSANFKEWQNYHALEREWGNITRAIEWCLSPERYRDFQEFWSYLKGFTRFYGYWDERLSWMDWLIEAAKQHQDWETVAKAIFDKAETLTLIDQPAQLQEAIALCHQALDFHKSSESTLPFDVMTTLVFLYINQEQFDQAREWLAKSENWLERFDGERYTCERLQIYLLYYQAQICLNTNELEQAKKLYDETLLKAESIGWRLGIIYIYDWLASVAIERGNLEEAESWLNRGWSEAKDNNDKRCIAAYKYAFARLEKARMNLVKCRHWAELAKVDFEHLKMLRDVKKINTFIQSTL